MTRSKVAAFILERKEEKLSDRWDLYIFPNAY